MDGSRIEVVTLAVDDLRGMFREIAREAAREVLALVLPPYSQHALPSGVSRRRFLEACRTGCAHRTSGRTLFVERSTWAAWQDGRPPRYTPLTVNVVKHPPPANGDIDVDELVRKSSRRK